MITTKLSPEEVMGLWVRFKHSGDLKAREELIINYQTLVHIVATRVGAKLPAHVDKDDLTSYGTIGLMDAMDKFDLDRGLKFETYAVTRINGQIFDELRKLDWTPRSVHTALKEAQSAYTELQASLQRQPTDTEVAERLNISVQQLSANRSEQGYVNMLALDAMLDTSTSDSSSSRSMVTQLQDRSQDPESEPEIDGIKYLIARAMRFLAERESIVLVLHYVEGLTLYDIGQLLGVTESRVCQLHTKAVNQIKMSLAD